jgi:hypothetical protein
MEPSSGTGPEKRPTVDLVKDRNGTDQILLQNPRGASVKVIAFVFILVSFWFSYVIGCVYESRIILRCKIQDYRIRC